ADAEFLAGRDDLGLDDPPEHRVLRLAGDQWYAQLAGQLPGGPELRRLPFRHADVERLAGPYDVGERLHRLFQRRLVVVPVRLVQVDVVGLQPPQRAVDRFEDVLAGQAPVVAARAGRPVDLGEDLQALPALPLQRPAEHRLRARTGVHVGRVERGDAQVEGGPHAGGGGVLLDLRAVGDPVAVRDLADHQARAAQVSELHGPTLPRARPGL